MSIYEPLHENESSVEHKETEEEKENERFTGHSPLVTLLFLSLGAIGSLVSAAIESVNLIIISKGLKNIQPDVTEIIGFASTCVVPATSFGTIFGQAITAYSSKLIGAGKRDIAAKLTNDVVRFTTVLSIFYAVGYAFVIKPFLKFCNCPSDSLQDSFEYVLPVIYLLPFYSLIVAETNYIQSIGRSILSGLVGIATSIITIILTVIFVFGFKTTSKYLKYPAGISRILLSIILFVLMYKGKFSLKLNFKMLLEKPIKETFKGILLGLPIALQLLYAIIPPSIILKSLTSADPDHSDLIGSMYSTYSTLSSLELAAVSIFLCGFLSGATYAFGAKNYERIYKLLGWTLLFSFIWVGLFTVVVVSSPKAIIKLFLNTEEAINYASQILPIPFYTSFLNALSIIICMFLIVIGKPILSLINITLQMVLICVGATLLKKQETQS